MSLEFSGKVAVITGGSGVLCSAMAMALSKAGAKVAVLGLTAQKVEKVAQEIKQSGGEAIGLVCNVLEADSLREAHKKVNELLGPCDILINGAGGNHPSGTTSKGHLIPEDLGDETTALKTFFDLDPEGIKYVFDLNFIGTLLPTQIFARDMVEKGGSIINISSMSALRPLTKIPAYSGAKAAVSNFTQWLAVHFSKVNIRVNALSPGFFLTDQNRALLTNVDGSLTDRGNSIISHTPMSRFGTPDDLIGALLWLCGEGSSFVTGVVIPVDGGFSAFSGV